jgi:hypothetical protein
MSMAFLFQLAADRLINRLFCVRFASVNSEIAAREQIFRMCTFWLSISNGGMRHRAFGQFQQNKMPDLDWVTSEQSIINSHIG